MIPAYYLLLAFLAQAFLTWLICDIMRDEHKITVEALVARNPQEMKMLQTPLPQPRQLPRRIIPDVEFEGDWDEAPVRPMGL